MPSRIVMMGFLTALIISACGIIPSSQPPTVDPNVILTQAFATVHASFTQTALAVPTITPTSTPYPRALFRPWAPGDTVEDVTYCNNGTPVKMDLYFPATAPGPWPTLIYIHGGSWIMGTKDNAAGLKDIPSLLSAGYLVASVNYRQAPESPFPAMIVDVKCAVRFLRAHALELNIDAAHMGVWGTSAGGHLASLLGLADESAGWDIGQYLEESSRVQAVAEMFGPTNLADPAYTTRMMEVGSFLLFGRPDPGLDVLNSASPLAYVSPGDPCFFVVSGAQDKTVDPYQGEVLFNKLQSLGIPATMVVITNSGHNFVAVDGPISPSRDEISQYLVTFFNYCMQLPQ